MAIALFLGGASLLLPMLPVHAQETSTRFIQVADIKLRKEPQFWAPGTADLKYGEAVVVLEDRGGWFRVRTTSGIEGYLPSSAITTKKVVLSGGAAPIKVQADDSDLVLAGKGFGEGLEKGLADADVSLNFAAVDVAERQIVDSERVVTFIRSGHLNERFE